MRTSVCDLPGPPLRALPPRPRPRGNTLDALSAATELQQVSLSDALELCLLLVRKEPAKYPRAALRWHGRYCREHRVSDPAEA